MAALTTPSLIKRTSRSTYISSAEEDADRTKIEAAFSAVNGRVNAVAALTLLTDAIAGTVADALAAIPDPTDAPATADALRDDLVANVLPKLRNALSSIASKLDAVVNKMNGL